MHPRSSRECRGPVGGGGWRERVSVQCALGRLGAGDQVLYLLQAETKRCVPSVCPHACTLYSSSLESASSSLLSSSSSSSSLPSPSDDSQSWSAFLRCFVSCSLFRRSGPHPPSGALVRARSAVSEVLNVTQGLPTFLLPRSRSLARRRSCATGCRSMCAA